MAVRRLVLLTNQYPSAIGDHVFVGAEVPALSARFDEVVVFNYVPGATASMLEMPGNVHFGGNLYGIPRSEKVKALFSPRNLFRTAQITLTEARTGRLRGHFRSFLGAATGGMGRANDARLKKALYEDGVETTVYSFWGMGNGLLVPWIRPSVGAVNLRLHRYDLYEEESGYLPFRPSLFRRSNRILAISEQSRRYLLDTYPNENLSEKIMVRRLGSAAPSAGPDTLTKEAGARQPGHLIVSCSNITEVKRVVRILDALEKFPLETPVTWIHFGGGALEGELRNRAAKVERDGLMVEIRGATPHGKILEYYRNHKIAALINVSMSEGVPVSIMEAISHDIPVIATDVGGTAEIVGKEIGTGELIPADFTDEELVAALQHVLDAEPGSYSPNALWAERFNAAVNAEATAGLIASQL
ncbi:glycosyltransferase [Arthrobacter sp.]|uniref:glycosyltransferase n=1 Tax=Arthrobacter sp. TaxID=1667 RepID=UPI0026DF224F|nr:glycosyltransferase [Arthrobacter sp.]MDO5751475.1 glycosyltransferase [Arthrobacter sp.]